ncbi:MAG: hypothetical protein ACRENX_09405 [Candidatus Dormibacteria bacterium]
MKSCGNCLALVIGVWLVVYAWTDSSWLLRAVEVFLVLAAMALLATVTSWRKARSGVRPSGSD